MWTQSEDGQYDEPVCDPLLRVVGDRLVGTSMRIQEFRLEDGTALHAYKHTPCDVRTRLDYALQAALCNWWILAGWEEEDARAVREAIVSANRSVA